jgi:hypothetical protein
MVQAIVLGFLAGLLGGTAFPHFVRGITRRTYPSVLGNSPVTNLVAGWFGLVGAALLAYGAAGRPLWALLSGAIGVLLIGLFHAGPGALPREAPRPAGGKGRAG